MAAKKARRAARPSVGAYYAASRLRTDSWQRLKARSREWAGTPRDPAAVAADLAAVLDRLELVEQYWAYPGHPVVARARSLFDDEDAEGLAKLAGFVVRMLASHAYRWYVDEDEGASWPQAPAGHEADEVAPHPGLLRDDRPYFEVLIVDDLPPREAQRLRERLLEFRRPEDEFVYDVVIVPSFEDALIAALLNYHLQAAVLRYDFPFRSRVRLPLLRGALARLDERLKDLDDVGMATELGEAIHQLRPTLDLLLVTDAPVEDLPPHVGQRFRRIFYRQEDYREQHLSILKGVRERYRAPFFSALRAYSQRPTGVFHALPLSRGKSLSKSNWLQDMEQFYGHQMFLAETSATSAGLDSLLQPHGSLREAQQAAARAFGAHRTWFVTNGTSTANKIVMQALTKPGDIVLLTRDCHLSHHYALALTGARPIYLDPYPLRDYGIFGAVPLDVIKRQLIALRDAGQLDRVRVLLLTNCTFDGIVYNPERVMEEVLAIHPEIVFVWDEAWFAFAAFTPITRRRTGMDAAARLRRKLSSPEYAARYRAWRADFDVRAAADPGGAWAGPLLPDPALARVRVYATQSTHKTLTSLRQGSMIHVRDDDFERRAAEAFREAYITHTSTSANYQILATLDLGRRQVELEGYELVQQAIELALSLRERINRDPLLSKYFRLLTPADLVPAEFRASGFEAYADVNTDWEAMDHAWESDEFCLDPTRLTLAVGSTGVDGDGFKRRLIDEFDIQINKTSHNTVLFMTHIGTTRGAAAYLLSALRRVATELAALEASGAAGALRVHHKAVARLTELLPPLPTFSGFHAAFQHAGALEAGDLRRAFFAASDDTNIDHHVMDDALERALDGGAELVAACFVTPYPPGFPVLVPGQRVSAGIVRYLRAMRDREIHGYDAELGLRAFSPAALAAASARTGAP